jgi:hypothetical protein
MGATTMAAAGKGKWIRRDETQWRALLSRFSGSGLSVAAFCEREALSTASFYRWRSLIEGHEGHAALAAPSQAAFVDLGALGAQSTARAAVDLRLDLGGGLSLHLVRR